MNFTLKRVEPQVSDDITDFEQETSIFKEERNAGPGVVYYPAGVFLVLKIMKADNLTVVCRINTIAKITIKSHFTGLSLVSSDKSTIG